MPNSVLYDLGADLLAAIVNGWTGAESLPARRFVTIGEAVHDCPQLTVSLIRVARGAPGAEETIRTERCTVARTLWMQVELIRCVTAFEEDDPKSPPDGVKLESEAAAIADDGWAMHSAVTSALAARTLFDICSQVVVGPMDVIGPQGGVAGWRMQVFTTV